MNGSLHFPSRIQSLTARRRARRQYWLVQEQAGETTRMLYESADPEDRAVLLARVADAEDQLAALHTAAFGLDPIPHESGRTMAEALASSAQLMSLYAATEQALAEAGYEPAATITAGEDIWFDDDLRAVTQVIAENGEVRLLVAGGGVVCGAGELVATGRVRTDVEALALKAGASNIEAGLWLELAGTPDREQRAELVSRVTDLAAGRVGGQAAEALACQIHAEIHLAAGLPAPRHPRDQMLLRGVVAAVFLLAGAWVVASSVLGWPAPVAASPLLGLVALVALVAVQRRWDLTGAVWDVAVWLRLRWPPRWPVSLWWVRDLPRRRISWSSWLCCKATGHRLGTAGHRRCHSHGGRCSPALIRWLPAVPVLSRQVKADKR
jgi:hypothetical protein